MSTDATKRTEGAEPLSSGEETGECDRVMLAAVIALTGFGLVMLYSASAVTAAEQFGDPLALVRSQAAKIGVGLVVLVGAMSVDYRWYRRLVYPMLGGTILMLGAVLVPGIGTVQNGARRWIDLGMFTVQPAEAAKVVAVVFLAYSVAKKGEKMHEFTIGFIPHLVVVGAMVGLLILQPDFGTSVILVTMMGVMLFVSGARLVYLSGFGILGLVAAYYAVVSSPYRMERITAFLEPWEHRRDVGYQISESLIAIGSGGLTGRGLGEGTGKLGYVPELSNDFIATLVGEELGLMGFVLLAGLFAVFIWRGCRIALAARDRFGTYLAFGLTTLIGIQAAGNLCVVTGLVPTKGLTLPFFSLGGSSLVMGLFAVGVLLNISRREPDWWELNRDEREKRRRQKDWEKRRERILKRRDDLEARA